MSRRTVGLVIAAFTVTRMVTAWLAVEGSPYEGSVAGDTRLYESYGARMVVQDQTPYSDFRFEYPPGALPVVAIPEFASEALSYRTSFVVLMVLVDASALVGLLVLARRWGSSLGVWLWVALIPILGPIAYLRLDLVPAAASVWVIERAAARRWAAAGALLMFAALVKVYALLLFPAALWIASDRRRFLLGAGAMALPLVLLAPVLDDAARSLVEYHGARGIQIESLWGSLLLIGIRRGIDASIVGNFGALHLYGELTEPIKHVGLLLSAIAVSVGTYLAVRFFRRGDATHLATSMFVIIVMTLALGTVLSPQFLMWVFAPAAALLCVPCRPMRLPVLLLAPTAALTQVIYPFFYEKLVVYDGTALILLYGRNLLLIGIASLAIGFVYTSAREQAIVWRRASETKQPAV